MSRMRFGLLAADMSELDYLGYGAHFPSAEPELVEAGELRLLIRDPLTRATIDCRGRFDPTDIDTLLASPIDSVALRDGTGGLLFEWTDLTVTIGDVLYTVDGGFGWDDALAGSDTVSGSPWPDVLRGYGGNDRIDGNEGGDTIDGDRGADWLEGGDGADAIEGDDGADTLVGGASGDTAVGGEGDDRFEGGAGDDLLRGGDGVDDARFAGRLGDHLITIVDPLRAEVTVADLKPGDGDEGIDTLSGLESIRFGNGEMRLQPPTESVPVGGPSTVLTGLPGPYVEQDWGRLDGGGTVLVWREYDTGGGGGGDAIRGQRFDADFAPVGTPFDVARLSAGDAGHAFTPSVAPLPGGRFVVAWTTSFFDEGGYDEDTVARVFGADGSSSGEAFALASGNAVQRAAKVEATVDGGFLAAWFEGGWSGGLLARRFDATGAPIGDGFALAGAQPYAFEPAFELATLADGAIVVVWNPSPTQPGTAQSPGLRGNLLRGDGSAAVPLDLTRATGYTSAPAIAPLADGGFAVAWSSYAESVPIQDYARGVQVLRFTPDGALDGEPIEAAPPSPLHSAGAPGLTGTLDGGFVVAWSGADAHGRRFDADGATLGAARFTASPPHPLDTGVLTPEAVLLENGDFLLAWIETAGRDTLLRAQRFSADWDAARYTSLVTGASDDEVRIGGGARVSAGPGNDTIHGSASADWIEGQEGVDTVVFDGPLGVHGFSRSTDTLRVVDRTAGRGGFDRLASVERLQFRDFGLNLTIDDLATLVDAATLDRLCELYVGFFGRVPAANGLEHWIGQFRAGKGIDGIADDFYGIGSSPDLRAFTGYWDFDRDAELSNADYVRIVYRNVLGREGRPEGIAYWSGLLETGTATRGSLVSTMLDAAHGLDEDPAWSWVARLLDDRTTMSKRIAVDWGLNYAIDPGEAITRGAAIAGAVRTGPNPDPSLADIPVVAYDFDAATALVGFDPRVLEGLA